MCKDNYSSSSSIVLFLTDSKAHAHHTVELNYNFISIDASHLYTPAHNFTVHGHPLLVHSAHNNKTAIVFNQTGQFLEFSSHANLHSCISDILHCMAGFSFSFELKILNALSLTAKTYILSSSGPLHPGIEMYHLNHTFYLSVLTTKIWSLKYPFGFNPQKWHTYRIVWNEIEGLILYIDGMNVISKTPSILNMSVTSQSHHLLIGSSYSNQTHYNANIMISGMTEIVYSAGKSQ